MSSQTGSAAGPSAGLRAGAAQEQCGLASGVAADDDSARASQ